MSTHTRNIDINRLREQYATQITKSIERLVENYQGLLKNATPSHDHSSNDASDFRIHTHAKNIGQAAEQLIQIIVKLRYKILLNDYPTIKKETQDAKLTFENLNDKTEKELNQIRDEVSEMLYKLEKSYYSTPTPSRSVTSSPCQEESHIL